MASFSAFSLSNQMVNALTKLGYISPSPVQANVIPKALRGKSILAQSATGSGKTHSFLIPVIEKTDVNLPRVQSIIIAPTRELARQIYEFAKEFIRFYPKLKIRLFTSEAEVAQNEEGLSVAPHMIIGTPGRLKDLLVTKHPLSLTNVRTVVLDEADMLLEMGYFEDIESLFQTELEEPQILVFSATLKQSLKDEIRKFVSTDFQFEAEETETSSSVNHHLVDIKHQDRKKALLDFINLRRPYLAIVFASKKETVDAAYRFLRDNGVEAIYFTGSLNDRARKKALRDIKANKTSIIIASDLLSRGMDIPDVTDVISLDLPSDLEFYYHRAGRTGRFDKTGDSWVFYDDDSVNLPKQLVSQGTKFDYYIFRNNILKEDPVGLAQKTKFTRKKAFESEEEKKEIKIAKALTRSDKVKPGYKRKREFAIDQVKHKYKRKAIQRSVRRQLEDNYRKAARAANEENE